MFSFGRNRLDDSGAEFWKWLPGARESIAKAIVSGAFNDRIVNDRDKTSSSLNGAAIGN